MTRLFTLCLLLCSISVMAQRQNVYFFKNNGQQVTVRDSADYTRVVREPDSGSVLYKVFEFYLNGKPRRQALSSTINPLRLEQASINYDKNGQKQSVLYYNKGLLSGEQHYYVNNKLIEVRNYPEELNKNVIAAEQKYLIVTLNDSTGLNLVNNGNGRYKRTENRSKRLHITTEGEIKNGLREGEWKIKLNRDSLVLTEMYDQGKMVNGKGQYADGRTYTYTKSEALPSFKGGQQSFNSFLSSTLRYPKEAQEKRIQGRVMVSFVVETDGRLSEIKVKDDTADPILIGEALRVLGRSPKWEPGVLYGNPARVSYTVPIVFRLQ